MARHTIGTRLTKNINPIDVVLLNAHTGTRMKSYGSRALLKFDYGPLYQIQRDVVHNAYSKPNIIMSTGFEADKIIKILDNTIPIVENQLYSNTNEVEEVRLAMNLTTEDNVLLIDGSILFNDHTIKHLDRSGIVVSPDLNSEGVGVTLNKGKVSRLSYGLEYKWCHILYLIGKELQLFKKIIRNRELSNLFLHEVINMMVDSGGNITVFNPPNMNVLKIDSYADYLLGKKQEAQYI